MAVTWGAFSGRYRLGIDLVRTKQTKTTETWRVDVYLNTGYGVQDSVNTFTVSGSLSHSGSVNVSLPFNGGTQKLWSRSRTFDRLLGRSSVGRVSVSLSGLYAGGAPSHTRTFTVAAQAVNRPAEPTNVRAVAVSPTQINVSWDNASTARAPATRVYMERRVGGGQWTYVGGFNGGKGSVYVDRSIQPGITYEYRVWASGPGGTSAKMATGAVIAALLPPVNVVAERVGDTVRVQWRDVNPVTGVSFEVYRNGKRVATVGASVVSWTDTKPLIAESNSYQVKAVYGGAVSGLSASYLVRMPGAPLGPVRQWPDGHTIAADESITFEWVHSPVDGSAQSQFEIRYRVNDAEEWTFNEIVASGEPVFTVADGFPVGHVDWQVRTWGMDLGKPGQWSDIARAYVAKRARMLITAPSASERIGESHTTAVFGPDESEAGRSVGWQATLERKTGSEWEQVDQYSGVIESVTGDGTDQRLSLTGLENKTTYRLTARSTGRLDSVAGQIEFVVDYYAPAVAVVETVWDPEYGRATLTVTNPVVSGTAPTVYSTVERVEPSGRNVYLGKVPPGGTVFDNGLSGNGVTEYLVVSYAESGTLTVTKATIDTTVDPIKNIILTTKDDQHFIRLTFNVDKSESFGLENAERHFFLGRTRAVMFTGREATREISVSATLAASESPETQVTALRAMVGEGVPVLYRDPKGDRMWGMVSKIDFDRDRANGQWHVSFKMEDVDRD